MTFVSVSLLLLCGGLAGLGAGFMGIGGGAVLNIISLYLFPVLGVSGEELVRIIFGTNMFLITVFSISSVATHHRNKRIDWRTVFMVGPMGILGAATGSWAATITNPEFLKRGFALVLIFSSLLIVIKGSDRAYGSGNGNPLFSRKLLPLLGCLTGALGSFLGIGGGVVMIPALILLFAIPVTLVAGTSSAFIIFMGIAGTFSYMFFGRDIPLDLPGWSTGYVWWSAAIPLMIGGVPMAICGAWLNARTRAKVLQRIFGVVLLVLALRILFS